MNRANQYALYQATNQGLLGIRQAEINYYINLCIAFGTQAALIGGFTYGIFTQNQFNEDTTYSKWFQDVYWVSSSGTIAASVHVILTSMLLQVLGPGLALHGPIGSMARACEGMRREQRTVITSFIIMIVLFSISTILSFWAVMTTESAAGATFVWLIASRYYYLYCERIYLRFYWKEEEDYWRRSIDSNDIDPAAGVDDSGYEPPVVTNTNEMLNVLHRAHGNKRNSKDNNNSDDEGRDSSYNSNPTTPDKARPNNSAERRVSRTNSTSIPAKKRFFNAPFSMFRRNTTTTTTTTKDGNHKNAKNKSKSVTSIQTLNHNTQGEKNPLTTGLINSSSLNYNDPAITINYHNNPRTIAMEGFLLIKRVSYSLSTMDTSAFKWERRYFTLNYAGHLFYYKSRVDFRENPRLPIHKRPLLLQDFFIVIHNSETDSNNNTNNRNNSTDVHASPFRPSVRSVDTTTNTHNSNNNNVPAFERAPSITNYSTNNEHYGNTNKNARIFQLTLIPRETVIDDANTNNNHNGESSSDSDHDSVTHEDRTSGKIARLRRQHLSQKTNHINNNGNNNTKNNGNNDSKKDYRREWVLRCDTAEELSVWVDIMQEICVSSFRS